MKLLCVSGSETLGKRVGQAAEQLNWNVVMVQGNENVTRAVHEHDPDLVLVDTAVGMDLHWWRGSSPERRHLICLHHEMNDAQMAEAFNSGADAILPANMFTPGLFEACIKSLLRRQSGRGTKTYIAGYNIWVDHETYTAEMNGQSLTFTDTEYKIFRILVRETDAIVTRSEILNKVFRNAVQSSRSLDVHICTLRKKVRTFGMDIVSVRGVGYKVRT